MTRDHVIRAAQAIERPRSIQAWSVVVDLNGDRREFPVKQLFMEAANQVASTASLVTPADFIPHFAQARLKKLGFEIRYAGSGSTGTPNETRMESTATMTTRATAVPERIANFVRERPGGAFCDDCVQKTLNLEQRQMVQLIASALGLTSDFRRGRDTCAACGRHDKLVTEAVPR